MAQWRVHIALSHEARATLDAEKVDISSRLDNRLSDTPVDWGNGFDRLAARFTLSWHGRFRNKAGADDLRTFLDSRVPAWQLAGITGKVSRHLCTHDELVPVDCSLNQYSEVVI